MTFTFVAYKVLSKMPFVLFVLFVLFDDTVGTKFEFGELPLSLPPPHAIK